MPDEVLAQHPDLFFFGILKYDEVMLALLEIGLGLLHLLDELEVLVLQRSEYLGDVIRIVTRQRLVVEVWWDRNEIISEQLIKLCRELGNLGLLAFLVLVAGSTPTSIGSLTDRTTHGSICCTAVGSALLKVQSNPTLAQVVFLLLLSGQISLVPVELVLGIDSHQELLVLIV